MTNVQPINFTEGDGRHNSLNMRMVRVVDAFIDLILDGDISPTPEMVAQCAGVSRASVFRYFDTLDELRVAAVGRVLERFEHLLELGEPALESIDSRISNFVASRLQFHETLHPLSLLQRQHAANELVAEVINASRHLLTNQVRSYFQSDLDLLDEEIREDIAVTISVLTSIESWQQLRQSNAWSQAQIRRAWILSLTCLLKKTEMPNEICT